VCVLNYSVGLFHYLEPELNSWVISVLFWPLLNMIRLFTELQDKNNELKFAIDQQGIVSLIDRCQKEEKLSFV